MASERDTARSERIRAWAESPDGFPIVVEILARLVFASDTDPATTSATVRTAIEDAYNECTAMTPERLENYREWCFVNDIRRTNPCDTSEGDIATHIAGFVPAVVDEIERLQDIVMEMTSDPLLTSPDLPPLPWSSAADHQPWGDSAGDWVYIRDANGNPVLAGRNWKEMCAAIEYLVRMANRGARRV